MPRQFSYQNSKPNAAKTNTLSTLSTLYQQLLACPVLVEAVGQVSSYYERDLLLAQLLGRNLKGICHALNINQDGSISTA